MIPYRELEIIIPAPRFERWWEIGIANMVGQQISVGGREMKIVWAGPLDGSPEEGASALVVRACE